MMLEARELWEASAGRSTRRSATCCSGHALRGADPAHASEALERAASEFERLGVEHLAGWARKAHAV